MKKIGIVMGSDSDLGIAEKAADTLKELGVPFEVHVYSAHRTPVQAADFAKNARKKCTIQRTGVICTHLSTAPAAVPDLRSWMHFHMTGNGPA